MASNRLQELDGIRGIAALSVVIYHYFYRYNDIYGHQEIPVDWSYAGKYGVQLFFMVSGFVIFWSLEKIKKPTDFLVSRFSRLYPTFWFCSFLTFSIVAVFGLPGRELSYVEALLNFSMIHEYFNVNHIDGVYWTLTVELTFYIWMFLFYLTNNLKSAEYIFTPFVLLSILDATDTVAFPPILTKILLLEYIAYFIAGICFYKIAYKKSNVWTGFVLMFCLISTAFIYSPKVSVLTGTFYAIFFGVSKGWLTYLSFKPFTFVGGISYSLYLIHQNIGYVVIRELYVLEARPLLSVAVALSSTILMAFLITKFVEKPMISRIRQLFKR